MDNKIMYIGLAVLFLVLVSTLALVIIVLRPDIVTVQRNAQPDSLTIKKGGTTDSLTSEQIRIYYDSLNYSLSMLVIKRENLNFIDSTKKLLSLIDHYIADKDLLTAEIKKTKDSVINYSKKYHDALKTVATATAKPVYSEIQQKGYAKIYESMAPENAAKQISEMNDMEAVKILLNIDSKQGAKILDKVEPKKAAKIWNALNSKGKK